MRGFRRPVDDFYNIQWHYQFIHMEPAWDLEIGSDDVVMAVIDSGIVQGHPDLTNRLARNANGTIIGMDFLSDSDADGDPGRDTNPEDPGDQLFGDRSSFHGTHVAGTMAAETGDEGEQAGVAGVTWAGRLVPVRVLGLQLVGYESDILEGIFWAIGDPNFEGIPPNPRPARVVNLSLGGPIDAASQQNWNDAFEFIVADSEDLYADPVFVAAAGNSDDDCSTTAPANVPGVIGVGAVRSLDGIRASYSNFGSCVDLMGPGGDNSIDQNQDGQADAILSTYENDYDFEQGTSMASPHVAGVAALLIAQNPALTAVSVQQILTGTANPQGECPEGCGAGWLDAFEALLQAGGTIEPVPRLAVDAVTVAFGDGVSSRTFRVLNTGNAPFDFTASIDGVQADAFALSVDNGTVPAAEDGGTVGITVTLTRGNAESGSANITITTVGLDPEQSALVNLEWNDDPNRAPRLLDTVEVAAFVAENGEYKSVKKTITTRAEGFKYAITGLVRGSYYVFAVADDNRDGTYDASIESVGGYPLISAPEALTLADDEEIAEINFPLIPNFITGIVGGIGEPCLDDDPDIADGRCTFAPDAQCITSFSGGYCTRDCTEDGECGQGGSCEILGCVDGQGNPFDCGVCLLSCLSDAQCRFDEGYVCDQFGTCSPQDL
jgi:serine protease